MKFNKHWLDDDTQVFTVEGLTDDDGDPCTLEIERHKDTGKIYVGLCYDEDRLPLFFGTADSKEVQKIFSHNG